MNKVISIDVTDPRSIDDAIQSLEEAEIWLAYKTNDFLLRLADEACKILEEKITKIEGDKADIVIPISYEFAADGSINVCADGEEILFLEFGTGTQTYPDTHPEKPAGIVGRGEYGKGHGKWKTWGFYSDEMPGRYGWNPKGSDGVILTHGIPAQMPVLETRDEIQRRAERIAREVFK